MPPRHVTHIKPSLSHSKLLFIPGYACLAESPLGDSSAGLCKPGAGFGKVMLDWLKVMKCIFYEHDYEYRLNE